MGEAKEQSLFRRLYRIEQELEHLKRDLLHRLITSSTAYLACKPSLFGCVRGGDITEEVVDEAKKDLFRDLEDL